MSLSNKAKQRPVIAALILCATIAGSGVAIYEGIVLGDLLVMSEAEAKTIHDAMNLQIANVSANMTMQAAISECRYLSDKKDRLEYELYVLRRDQADPDLIQLKSTAFGGVTDKYNALNCVTLI